MKRFLLIFLSLLLVIAMTACDFLFAQPQILLDGKEIETLEMEMGKDITLSSNITEGITWKSSDDSVVKATSAGRLFALKEGTVTVTLTAGSKTNSITVTVITPPTMWTIGDSIFDFNDNGTTSPIYRLVEEAGYINSCMDNIGGATIYGVRGTGDSIEEHMQTGLYDEFYARHGAPDLIVIFRGTNDVYGNYNLPDMFTMQRIRQSVENVCQYFSAKYPDTRIVWATPIWRTIVTREALDEFRQMLHTVCPKYGVEVFDLHLVEPFASLNNDNYADVLYDGIHPTFLAALQMKDAFVNYLKSK